MIKNKKIYFYSIAGTLYLISLLGKYNYFSLPSFLQNYLADFLALPLILGLTVGLLRYIKKDQSIALSLFKILFSWLYISVFFEFLLPYYSARYIQDYADILMYFLGASWFYVLQKRGYFETKSTYKR